MTLTLTSENICKNMIKYIRQQIQKKKKITQKCLIFETKNDKKYINNKVHLAGIILLETFLYSFKNWENLVFIYGQFISYSNLRKEEKIK